MKATFLQVLGSWFKAALAAVMAFVLLQYSNGLVLTDLGGWALFGAGVSALIPAIIKYMDATEGWFNTVWGGLVKTTVTVALSLIIARLAEGSSLFEINLPNLVNSIIPVLLPSLINILNPADSRYGINKES